jgi:hypothetical protein
LRENGEPRILRIPRARLATWLLKSCVGRTMALPLITSLLVSWLMNACLGK